MIVANAGVELPHAPTVEATTTTDDRDRVFAVNAGRVFAVCLLV